MENSMPSQIRVILVLTVFHLQASTLFDTAVKTSCCTINIRSSSSRTVVCYIALIRSLLRRPQTGSLSSVSVRPSVPRSDQPRPKTSSRPFGARSDASPALPHSISNGLFLPLRLFRRFYTIFILPFLPILCFSEKF